MFCVHALVTIEGSLWSADDTEEPPSKTGTRSALYISSLTSLRSSLLCSVLSEKSCVQYPCLPVWNWGLKYGGDISKFVTVYYGIGKLNSKI